MWESQVFARFSDGEEEEKLLLLFPRFPRPSSASSAAYNVVGTTGDSILQLRNNCTRAAVIFRACAVSLIFIATSSRSPKLQVRLQVFLRVRKDLNFS